MPIVINLDAMLANRKMSLSKLSREVGVSVANLSILKRGKGKAIRFSLLNKICETLDCQPRDVLEHQSCYESVVKEKSLNNTNDCFRTK